MLDAMTHLSDDAFFEDSLGRAILAARHGTRQVGALLIDFEHSDGLDNISRHFAEEISTLLRQARAALNDAIRIKKNYVLFSHDAKRWRHAPLRMSRLRQAIIGDE